MIMNFLDVLELIERKYGILGTVFGIALILVITILTVIAINAIIQVYIESLNALLIKFFDIRLY